MGGGIVVVVVEAFREISVLQELSFEGGFVNLTRMAVDASKMMMMKE